MTLTRVEPSPRVRGKPRYKDEATANRGAFPACTGKTLEQRGMMQSAWSLPRVYGENGYKRVARVCL